MPYLDSFERPIEYLRVSVTDRCNLRCVYCMPEEGVKFIPHASILRYEEIVRIVRVAVGMGMKHVRLTGGEPLVRADIVELVRQLAAIPGLDDLSMTTNGILLERYAEPLAEAGLKRVNISLDTLRPERFRRITRLGTLEKVLRGREAALKAGLKPVKINVVVVRGLNDDEVVDLARLSLEEDWHVRFIEVMPLGGGVHWAGDAVRRHLLRHVHHPRRALLVEVRQFAHRYPPMQDIGSTSSSPINSAGLCSHGLMRMAWRKMSRSSSSLIPLRSGPRRSTYLLERRQGRILPSDVRRRRLQRKQK